MKNGKLRAGIFGLSLLVGISLFYCVITSLLSASFAYQELYSHIPVVPVVSVYFLFLERKSIFGQARWGWGSGVALMAVAVLINLAGRQYRLNLNEHDYLSLMMSGLFVWTLGCFLSSFGVASAKKAAFPLLFLAFMIPIPTFLLDPLVRFLQLGSAQAAYYIFKATGVPVYREGFVFSLPGLTVEVADECSGIRSGIALFITSVVAGKLFLDKSWLRFVLALSVFPIAMFKNGMRIATLSLLGAYVDPKFITGSWLHRSGGVPFFVVALLFLLPVVWGLRKAEKPRAESPSTTLRVYDREQGAKG